MTPSLLPKLFEANSVRSLFLFIIAGLAVALIVVSIQGYTVGAVSQQPAQAAQAIIAIHVAPPKAAVVTKPVQKIAEAHLKIPKIGVDAIIKDMGVTSEGAMAVPSNRIDVGWYSLGTKPGERGSAVIGAHSLWNSKPGLFAHLDTLEKGDIISVVDAKGMSISFIVTDLRTYDAADTNTGIFESESGAHLNLITCSGEWDAATQTYTKRLVVFTDIVPVSQEIAMVPVTIP